MAGGLKFPDITAIISTRFGRVLTMMGNDGPPDRLKALTRSARCRVLRPNYLIQKFNQLE